MISKQKPWRNKKYIAWVKTHPCIVTRLPADDPHHIIGHGFSAMGSRAPDWAVIPLTRKEHNDLHRDLDWWETLYGSQVQILMRFWRENWDEIQGFFNEAP